MTDKETKAAPEVETRAATKVETKVATQAETLQKVDRVRDIIFGHQMRDYEQRFQLVQRDLDRLQQELDRLNEHLTDHNADQVKQFQGFRRDMRQADDDLRAEMRHIAQRLTDEKVDRIALGELFVEVGSHLKAGGSIIDFLKNLDPKIE
jgi:hypothetical protein